MKIRILNESFYQGKDTTVCTLKCKIVVEESSIYNEQPEDLQRIIRNHFEQQSNFSHDCGYLGHFFTVKASTKCKGDKFDEVKGERIAEAKAFKKVYKIGLQLSSIMLEYLNNELANWDYAYNKYDDLIFQEDNNISSLTD